MEIRPTYLIFVSADNHNKFYNAFPEGNEFRVEYGRVNSTCTTIRYPISKWNSTLTSKIKKGYKDITDLKSDLVQEVSASNSDMTYKEIENMVIRNIVNELQRLAKETVKKNYTVAASAVTQAMVDSAQSIIDDLSNNDYSIEKFNKKLLELFAVIPRNMSKVNNHLIADKNEIPKKLKEEQDLLDVLAGQVYVKPDAPVVTEAEKKQMTILEELGLEFEEVDDNDVKLIKKLMNESKDKFKKAWRVKNLETQERFDKFVADNNITDTRLLFHGSRSENFWSIIKTGLKIRPSNAVYTGSMFSDGLYFAPKCQKSIGYTSLSGSYWAGGSSTKGYMAIFEVAYGTPHVIYQHDSSCYRYNYDVLQSKKPKCHCLHASASKGMLRNDEIVFYRTDQVTIKYLIEIGY